MEGEIAAGMAVAAIRIRNRIIFTVLLITLPVTARADLDLPVSGPVTSGVGWRLDPLGSGKIVFHRGIDISVPVGTPVHATRGGHIVFAGTHSGHGATVIVEHGNGDRTLYGHNSAITVRLGERVEAGSTIALSGNSGRSTGPHVHFEALRSGRAYVEIAQAEEIAVPERTADRDLRRQQEQRMEDAVDSILRRINRSSLNSGNVGQGG